MPRVIGVLIAAAVLSLPLEAARAQTYPNRPIRFVAPQPPGGAYDYFARLFGERIQAAFGQPVIVDNRAGAATIIGTEYVARQPADGHTLLMTTETHVVLGATHAKLPYDPIRDFDAVSLVVTVPFVLAVSASSSLASARDYIAAARARPGSVTFASSGVGSGPHLAGELLKSMTGVDMVHVPYKGFAAVIQAILSGEVVSTFGPVGPLLAQLKAGKLRPMAVLTASPSALLPGVPTLAEAGPVPGYDLGGWAGVLAPAGTPRAIIDKLAAEINRAVHDAQFARERILSQGYDPVGTTPDRFMEVMKRDVAKYAKLVKDANIPQE